MKILLVRPHLYLAIAKRFNAFLRLEPLDIELTAAGVPAGHEVQILDLTLEYNPIRAFDRKIKSFSPDILGFGGYSSQAQHIRQLALRAKAARPGILVIAGGVHATIAPADFKKSDVIDAVIRGDGVSAMEQLVNALAYGGSLPESEYILPIRSEKFDALAETPPPCLNERCLKTRPRRDLINPKNYFCVCSGLRGERLKTLFPPVASMRTSVGCPHRCSFCVVHFLASGKYLQRAPEDVVDEIESLEQEHIYFVDDEMFINPKRAQAIAELLLSRDVKKKYISWARADTICAHPEVFKLWKQAGLETLYVGLESLEENYLQDYNKGVAPAVNRQAVEMLRELDIGLHAAFIVNPDFAEQDFLNLRKSMDFVLPAEISFTVLSPSPGTAMFEENKDRFICDDPYLFYDCMHTLLPTRLPLNQFYRYFSLLYLFAFRKNPWRAKKIKVPFRDMLRLMLGGVRCGWTLRHIYKDYDRRLW